MDGKTTMRMFIDFIGDHIRDIFVIYSLHRVYRGLKERIVSGGGKLSGRLSEVFLDFEVCGNTGSSENIFLLNLFCDIHGGGELSVPPYTNESLVIRYPSMLLQSHSYVKSQKSVAASSLCILAPQLPLWGKITDRFMIE